MHIIKYFHTSNIVDLWHSIWKNTKTQKLNFDHWNMKMRSGSDDTCQLDTYTLWSFHTPNIVDLLHTVSENRPKHTNLTVINEPWKWGQGHMTPANWTCTPYIHQIYYTCLILSEIWTWPPKLNLVFWSMKWGRGQVTTVCWACRSCKVCTYRI